jgi:adenosylmethionine-8-amino-7-oxononanoate aminotransferase
VSDARRQSAPRLFGTEGLPKVAFGKGSYVTDADGKTYLDGSGGPAVYCVGHANAEVNAAIAAQLDKIAHGYRYMFSSDPLEELQALIARHSSGGLRHSVVVSGGSEAVESCLKIALQYQNAIGQASRTRFIARRRSWHGNTLGALSVSDYLQRREPFEGALLPASFVSAANAYRPPAGVAPDALADYCADELEREITSLGAERVCAFVFEPVVGAAGGAVPAPPGYAQKIKAVCERHGVLMLADEVMCGVGRCGSWRALAHDGVEPDLMAIAKGLAGGYLPLGAAVFQASIADAILERHGEILTGHTFSGHTTCCAAGVAVQRILEREHLVERVASEGVWLMSTLRDALAEHPHVGDIRGRGFFIGVEFVADRESKRPFDSAQRIFSRIGEAAFQRGLICYPVSGNVDGRRGDIAILAPPYNASRAELAELVEKLSAACRAVLDSAGRS